MLRSQARPNAIHTTRKTLLASFGEHVRLLVGVGAFFGVGVPGFESEAWRDKSAKGRFGMACTVARARPPTIWRRKSAGAIGTYCGLALFS
jgi:hypothetical protein